MPKKMYAFIVVFVFRWNPETICGKISNEVCFYLIPIHLFWTKNLLIRVAIAHIAKIEWNIWSKN